MPKTDNMHTFFPDRGGEMWGQLRYMLKQWYESFLRVSGLKRSQTKCWKDYRGLCSATLVLCMQYSLEIYLNLSVILSPLTSWIISWSGIIIHGGVSISMKTRWRWQHSHVPWSGNIENYMCSQRIYVRNFLAVYFSWIFARMWYKLSTCCTSDKSHVTHLCPVLWHPDVPVAVAWRLHCWRVHGSRRKNNNIVPNSQCPPLLKL